MSSCGLLPSFITLEGTQLLILASRFLRRKFDDVTFQGENDVTCQRKNDVIQQNKMAANVAADLILSAEQDKCVSTYTFRPQRGCSWPRGEWQDFLYPKLANG